MVERKVFVFKEAESKENEESFVSVAISESSESEKAQAQKEISENTEDRKED